MRIPLPTSDGQVVRYAAVEPEDSTPRIYYVNGIQTDPQEHAEVAIKISILTEHVVYGLYNATAGKNAKGFGRDIKQCVVDTLIDAVGKLIEVSPLAKSGMGSISIKPRFPHFPQLRLGGAARQLPRLVRLVERFIPISELDPTGEMQRLRRFVEGVGRLSIHDVDRLSSALNRVIPTSYMIPFLESILGEYNPATVSLFRQLRERVYERQMIVCHSQGNLVTSNALWAMVIAFGESSLQNISVYSLAPPTPVWPYGLRGRRKVYAYTNDPVTFCDPHNWSFLTEHFANGKFKRTAGDWRQLGAFWIPTFDAHDVHKIIQNTNFTNSIRRDLGLPPMHVSST